ncbi:MAG: fructosamine kinase family protein [Lachnospiraceae bacterium]|nr:fructosamine kinase family protein [Lachnospiraceae bacterium]
MNRTNVEHFTSLEEAISSLFGEDVHIEQKGRIHGGDINEAYRISLSDGNTIFMKMNQKENLSFFQKEVTGLLAIQATNTVSSPKILCTGTDDKREISFLLLEMISGGNRLSDAWEVFAHELAAMHRADTKEFVPNGKYGFLEDNYIGAGEQKNTPGDSFIPFFREQRLEPQIRRASRYFSRADLKKMDALLSNLEKFLIEPERPSLLHGDMWSGNVITGNDGKIWLIDPAAYVGHPEADIAMTELFGRFSESFYETYRQEGLIQPGYSTRRSLYNLYHMLNHLNLFGGSYLQSVLKIVDAFS